MNTDGKRGNLFCAALLAGAALFYLYYGVYKVLFQGRDIFGGDFGICYVAAQNLVNGISVYFRPPDRDIYLYAPPVTLLFLPFIKLPEFTARLVWLGLCHLLSVFVFWRLWLWGRASGRLLSAAAAAGAVLLSMPVHSMVMMGNVNILLFALLPALYGALLAGRRRLAPAVLAFFAVAKIFPGLLAGALLRGRDRRGLAYFLLWLVAAAVFSLAAFGVNENMAFLFDLPGFTKYAGIRHSQSLTFFVKLFVPGIGIGALAVLNAAFLSLLLAAWWKVSGPGPGGERPAGAPAADLFVLTAVMMLTAPSAWIMYGAFYAVPFYFVLHSALEGRREFRAAWLFWACFAVISFWEIFYYQLPLGGGLTMRQVWLNRELHPVLYRYLFSILFFVNLGLYAWSLINYGTFAAAAARLTGAGQLKEKQ